MVIENSMIKRVKELDSHALIASKEFREFAEKFESEINRGISTLSILAIIMQSNSEGTYAYKILKELRDQTKDMLIIEEGTLYPLLSKLEHDGLIKSTKQETGRKRKYYSMTDNGAKVFNHISGYFAKLSEAISPLFDMNVGLKDQYLYCPNCANKIDILNSEHQFCEICGLSIKELKERRLEK